VRLYAGDPLPPAHDAGAVAVLGSEETPYDDTVPWLPGEVSYLAEAVSAAVPVLGICFGGQLLARVLGARLYRLPGPEIGWVHMSSAHPAVAAGPWLAYHRDAFELPRGAAELARNDVCPQAFAAGPHVGVQFHPEATAPIFRSWLTSPAHALSAAFPGTDGDPAWRRARENAHRLFSAWLDGELG
jgi:GMP synthase-like glutamine amidotransferase